MPLGRVPAFSAPGFGINEGLMTAWRSEILQREIIRTEKQHIRSTLTVEFAASGILVKSASELHL